jgi:hypothetical protein
MIETLAWATAALAAIPAATTLANLAAFRPPPAPPSDLPLVSVILPVRNEASAIEPCLAALSASTGADIEIIVVDDASTDDTAARVLAAARDDHRIRLHTAPPLPPGWAGKMHACAEGARHARGDILLFLDCDVRVEPHAVAAMAGSVHRSGVALASFFPRQHTPTFGEALLIPLIHVVLMGWLPIWLARRFRHPAFGAGCGQAIAVDAAAYRQAGGHRAIAGSWHDGLHLPRAFRRAGLATDIHDGAPLATCRMYRGLGETWRGLAKNARAGMATPVALPVWTLLLGGGMLAPFLVLPLAWSRLPGESATWALTLATALLVLARILVAIRFGQRPLAVLLWPAGIAALLALQWRVLLRPPRTLAWRGRTHAA